MKRIPRCLSCIVWRKMNNAQGKWAGVQTAVRSRAIELRAEIYPARQARRTQQAQQTKPNKKKRKESHISEQIRHSLNRHRRVAELGIHTAVPKENQSCYWCSDSPERGTAIYTTATCADCYSLLLFSFFSFILSRRLSFVMFPSYPPLMP